MPDVLRQRLRSSHHADFVGREDERAFLRETIEADTLPVHLVMIHGPGGIGKTSLLEETRVMAEAHRCEVARLDGRDLASTPDAFAQAVEAAFDGAAETTRRVLLVDTYEELAPLDDWLRRTFLPTLPDDTLVVLAGRAAPAVGWRTDPGWRAELAVLPLRNLSAEESAAFLNAQGVDDESREAALAFTHGHPLALALVADYARQKPGQPFVPDQAPDVIGALLARFVQEEPDPRRRAALEVASLVRTLTEPLLATLLDEREVHDAFGWLRGLSFVEVGPRGLWPHDLARDVIATDLRWRDPARHAEVHARARRFYTDRLLDAEPEGDLPQTLGDYAFLYRESPIVQPFFDQLREAWQRAGHRAGTDLRDEDREALLAMTRRHEGDASADILAHWLDRQPEGATVFRDADGTLQGFLLTVDLSRAAPEAREADPVAASAWRAMGPIREGERALLFRHWMDAETHQSVSAVQSLAFAATVRTYLTTPGLAVSMLATTEPELWGPVLGFARLQPVPEADGLDAALFVHDWRAEPPEAWLDALAGQTARGTPSPPRPRTSLVVLSRDGFEDAVRESLREYARPHKLRTSPLLQSRLVREAAPDAEDDTDRIEALRETIAGAAAQLEDSPREAPYGRALRAAYLDPAPTQHLAAERVGVPFSTFRRHLGRGVDHVVDELWRRETT